MESIKRILRPKEAYARAGITRVTAWRLEQVGKFPPAVRISEGRKGYLESDINAWIDQLIAKRDETLGQGEGA